MDLSECGIFEKPTKYVGRRTVMPNIGSCDTIYVRCGLRVRVCVCLPFVAHVKFDILSAKRQKHRMSIRCREIIIITHWHRRHWRRAQNHRVYLEANRFDARTHGSPYSIVMFHVHVPLYTRNAFSNGFLILCDVPNVAKHTRAAG